MTMLKPLSVNNIMDMTG